MAFSNSTVLRCVPRRICFSVSNAYQRSTWLIHEAEVGVDAVGDFGSYPIIFVGAQLGTQFPTNNDGMYLLHVYGTPTTSANYVLFTSN
jgi:hypothetical protein